MALIEIKLLALKKFQPLYKFIAALILLSILPFNGNAQEKKAKQIQIKQAKFLKYSKEIGEKNRLIGDVIFEHEGALMYCDSAWLYDKENKIEAFNNIKLNQGDTLFLWGDHLDYSGNTKMARVTGKVVKLQDPKMELTTDILNFDRKKKLAYYTTGGRIINDENTLTSKKGYYNTQLKTFNFKDSVVLVNPDYAMYSDTLNYNTKTRISYFHGPTQILSDSSSIYCENGLYNTVLDIAQFEENAILNSKNKILKGDSLYYEAKNDLGEVFGNIFIHDTVDHYVITGNYAWYNGELDSAFVTQNPIYSILQDGDTLHIHGDTLQSNKTKDSLGDYRLVRAYNGVKFYKTELQGKCDSLAYSSRDSTLRMYRSPVLWNDSTQIVGDTIFLTMFNNKLDSLKVYSNSFMISLVDPLKFNQIKGKVIFGKFGNNKLKRVFVNGNGQTIYYPKDDKDEFIGMNKSVSSYIAIRLQNGQVKGISFLKKPEVKLHALNKISPEESKLEGFKSYFDIRPKSKADLLK